MADGPNFEKVFQDMSVFNGNDPNDVRVIKQYLRFYKDTESFALYAKHYLPMLSVKDRAEFEEDAAEVPVKEKIDTTVTEIETKEESPVVSTTNITEIVVSPSAKKKSRPSTK